MLSSFSHPDIHSVRHQIRSNKADAGSQMRTCQEIARSAACLNTFRNLNPLAIEQSLVCDPQLPLAGLSVSVKDLFDVQGEITTSGGRILESSAPARKDATAVARLKAAGGVVIGRTHMVELAFSGIGINPHFGTPVNPYALQVDPTQPRIPGGSSSGAAVSVASGAAFIGLGSDTGGSLRIPAALCGLVGFKPTASSVPSDGATELSRSLDTVGAITRSVRDAVLSHEILSGHALPESRRQLRDRRFAVVQTLMLNDLDETVSANFEKSLSALRQAGATIQELNLEDIQDLGHIQSRGGFAAPELQTWLIDAGLWPSGKSHIDPRVAERIALADNMKATDYIRLQRARQSWIAKISASLQEFDAILSPTVPMVAPPIALVAPGHERDAAFFRINALLLRNTSVVNMLDGCAISLPNHAPNSLPTGLMLWHCSHHDEDILHTALQIESIIR